MPQRALPGRELCNSEPQRGVRRRVILVGLVLAFAIACWPALAARAPLKEAAVLTEQAMQLYHAGNYAEAIPLSAHALAINEKTLGPNHPDVATALNFLAVLYMSQGSYADAEPLFRRALTIYQKVGGRDTTDVAMSLNNLAQLLFKQGRYSEAEPLYRHALAIREKVHGPNHEDMAVVLNNLGQLYDHQGRYAEGGPLLRRALAINEKVFGPDHPQVSIPLNNLALLYANQGHYSEAEPLYRRALAIREKALGPDHPAVATALNNLAKLYINQARYAEGEPLYRRALAINEKALGRDHPAVASMLGNLALVYHTLGRYAEAEQLYRRALAVDEKALGPDHPNVGTSLNNLAGLYENQGRYAEAEQLYRRALAVHEKALGPDHPNVGKSLNNLGALYRDQARYAEAEQFYRRALAVHEKALGPDHPAVAVSQNNLAVLYRDQGHYDEAEPLFRRALAVHEKALGPDHPDVALSLNNLAALYDKQRRSSDALSIVHRLINERRAFNDPTFAVLLQARAERLIDPARALEASYDVVQRTASSAAAEAVTKLAVRFAAGTNELARLVRQDQDLAAEASSKDRELVAASAKLPAERNATNEAALRNRLAEIKTGRDRLQEVFNRQFPSYIGLAKPQPVSVAATQSLLAGDEALLVFDFDTTSYAWVITSDSAEWTDLNITARELDAQIKTLRQSLTSSDFTPYDTHLAYQIYQATFGRLAAHLKGRTRLSVVTNGAFTSLPPQLLVTQDPAGKPLKDVRWLVQSYTVTILPSVMSLQVLRRGTRVAAAAKPMIAFADPVFSKMARVQARVVASITRSYRGTELNIAGLAERLPQLPATRREVEAIGKVLRVDSRDIILGLAATETAVKQAKLDQYRIVYFATHGLVAGAVSEFAKTKAEPALVLSIPDKPTPFDDGLLQASEVAQLKLNAEWVVLSACNTAAEDQPGAEALSGLARAFFYAGARSLIVSHWEVDDDVTARLMSATFRLHDQQPKLSHAEALQRSILAIIDSASSDDDLHPRLWAPFVVVGEPAKPN